MGEVYRARDTRLNRDVAIKVLLTRLRPTRSASLVFKREAQLLASLNHPHIAAIYGIEETDGARALVLELVEGPTLADRIEQGPIPPQEALAIARQIAEALEAAHEQGVVHRDLKPANIKVRADDTVKVLDFGLAKALDPGQGTDLSQSPTLTTPAATMMGTILGTAAYMAPEQARGKAVDRRADIWAFGVVLYEMLTGRKVFGGEAVTETLGAIIHKEPSWTTCRRAPAGTRGAAAPLPAEGSRQRLRDIGDARIAIDDAIAQPLTVTPARGKSRRAAWGERLALVMISIALLATLPIVVSHLREMPPVLPAALQTMAPPRWRDVRWRGGVLAICVRLA
jgi:serine/threonine-protein kinase